MKEVDRKQGIKEEERQERVKKEVNELCSRTQQNCAFEMLTFLQVTTVHFLCSREMKYWLLKKTYSFVANQIPCRSLFKGLCK